MEQDQAPANVFALAIELNNMLPQVKWTPPVNFTAYFLGKKLDVNAGFAPNRFNQRGVACNIFDWVIYSLRVGLFPQDMEEENQIHLIEKLESEYAKGKGDPFVPMLTPLDTPQRARNWICNAWMANYYFCKNYGLIENMSEAELAWKTIAVENLKTQIDAVCKGEEYYISNLFFALPDRVYKDIFAAALATSDEIIDSYKKGLEPNISHG